MSDHWSGKFGASQSGGLQECPSEIIGGELRLFLPVTMPERMSQFSDFHLLIGGVFRK